MRFPIPVLLLVLAGGTAVGVVACAEILAGEQRAGEEAGGDWIADPADSICGLSDPRMVSSPAVVRYATLYQATPEIQRLEREGIDPHSAAGIVLREEARKRVQRACDVVRAERDHCSVWKRIRHRHGRAVPDITAAVLPRL